MRGKHALKRPRAVHLPDAGRFLFCSPINVTRDRPRGREQRVIHSLERWLPSFKLEFEMTVASASFCVLDTPWEFCAN